nr:cell division protein ZapE [Dasania marina]
MAVPLSPRERYQLDLQRDDFSYDVGQKQAVELLQQLYERLLAAESAAQPTGLKAKLLAGLGRRQPALEPVKGLYFWGGVGRGKTYLMDAFYDALPFDRKMRVHFHRFMRRVHADLKVLQGDKNPLQQVARGIADEARVICFDEFFVSDITDAMILGGLFELLFDYGVSLVATSNIIPDGLYKDGLQRSRFLPTIAMLNKHTQVVNVDSGVDYRLRTLEQAELYHYPLDAGADSSLQRSFDQLNPDAGHVRSDFGLEINGRQIQARRVSDDVAWFDFGALCDGPRSQNDYIELAKEFHAVLISGVPQLGGGKDDQTRRFINLIDEFYDRHVKLVIAAQVSLAQLYAGGRLSFEFERTQSRLLEMQSHDYLALEHRP